MKVRLYAMRTNVKYFCRRAGFSLWRKGGALSLQANRSHQQVRGRRPKVCRHDRVCGAEAPGNPAKALRITRITTGAMLTPLIARYLGGHRDVAPDRRVLVAGQRAQAQEK